ncbi:alpha/beta hydrolase [Ramlibacter tataouinensis]|uniref:alpha/beta hydrolase family protein n=1 Tax=Ramlibacter tataouinensis TaxID=94132 RepID=UPI0022F3AFEF|nr:alpha/beta family hydrolase [Ramlibacter tataouinensis]WBY03943.1 alpha/beta hydrolase [Ramlibacter tataouinensis]
MQTEVSSFRVDLPDGASVSALLCRPLEPIACLVLAHGAGAGMHHPFMADLAAALGARAVATLRFQFPFMEQGSKRPDRPAVAQMAVRAAVAQAAARLPGIALFAGGKSFGGRMSSQAQAESPLPHVRGLVFAGFPLHPAGKPAIERAAHLEQVAVPMLFLQGARDALADLPLIRQTVARLGSRTVLHVVDGADHAFHVLVRSGRSDAEVIGELADVAAAWMGKLAQAS